MVTVGSDDPLLLWLDRMTEKYPFLTVSTVRDCIFSAIRDKHSQRWLEDQLTLFVSSKNDVSGFVSSLYRDIDQILLSKPVKRAPTQPKQRKEQTRMTSVTVKASNEEVQQVSKDQTKTSSQVPSSFISGFTLSKKLSEAKQSNELKINEKGQRIDEDGNVVAVKIKSRTSFQALSSVYSPQKFEFRPLPLDVITKSAEEARRHARNDQMVAQGSPLYDVIALSRASPKPAIDWWDVPYVEVTSDNIPVTDETGEWVIKGLNSVTPGFENMAPVSVKKPIDRPMPELLTTEQRKRIRRIRTLDKQAKERLLQRLRLVETEPGRITPQALPEITKTGKFKSQKDVEFEIMKQKEERIKKHEETNEKLKLTDEQRKEKLDNKRFEDSQKNQAVTIFRVNDLSSNLQLATIQRMAKKWYATGGIFHITTPPFTFVVFEAGQKGTRKIIALMERRIQWGENNSCEMIFSGLSLKKRFKGFRKYSFDVATQCMEFCRKNNADDVFDAAARFSAL